MSDEQDSIEINIDMNLTFEAWLDQQKQAAAAWEERMAAQQSMCHRYEYLASPTIPQAPRLYDEPLENVTDDL